MEVRLEVGLGSVELGLGSVEWGDGVAEAGAQHPRPSVMHPWLLRLLSTPDLCAYCCCTASLAPCRVALNSG